MTIINLSKRETATMPPEFGASTSAIIREDTLIFSQHSQTEWPKYVNNGPVPKYKEIREKIQPLP